MVPARGQVLYIRCMSEHVFNSTLHYSSVGYFPPPAINWAVLSRQGSLTAADHEWTARKISTDYCIHLHFVLFWVAYTFFSQQIN